MRELLEVLDAAREARRSGKAAIMATVVEVEGSAYRRPGARMLIAGEGWRAGGVSGGCLEADLLERAWRLTEEGGAAFVTYDTTSEMDAVLGIGAGCRGVVRVLVERLVPSATPSWVTFLDECVLRRARGVMATVFRLEGTAETRVGARLCLDSAGRATSDLQDPALTEGVRRDAWRVMESGLSETAHYTLPGGSADVFLEALAPPIPLVIFGAGHDAIPIVRIAKEMGWHVTVVDSRPAYASAQRFPSADAVVLSQPDAIREHVQLDADTVALVMTHNYPHDRKLLTVLLPSPVRYLGILGPRHRTDRLLQDLTRDGVAWSDEQASRLHAPVGLDIGADTPEGIALAILAEIQAVLAGRSGGFLRQRQGPIHGEGRPDDLSRREALWTGTMSHCEASAS